MVSNLCRGWELDGFESGEDPEFLKDLEVSGIFWLHPFVLKILKWNKFSWLWQKCTVPWQFTSQALSKGLGQPLPVELLSGLECSNVVSVSADLFLFRPSLLLKSSGHPKEGATQVTLGEVGKKIHSQSRVVLVATNFRILYNMLYLDEWSHCAIMCDYLNNSRRTLVILTLLSLVPKAGNREGFLGWAGYRLGFTILRVQLNQSICPVLYPPAINSSPKGFAQRKWAEHCSFFPRVSTAKWSQQQKGPRGWGKID